MWVIPDLLRGAAQALNGAGAAIGGAAVPATALPPAPDVASLAAIGRLNMYAMGLANALTEGSQRLTYLDGKLNSDASHYESTDSANAQNIAAAGGLSGVGGDLVSTDGGAAPQPMAPAASSATSPGGMPAIPPLAVPGEAFAALLESAPGSTSLSGYLSTLKGVLSTLEFSNPLVDRGRGMVMEGWNSGDSGSNPAEAATSALSRMTQWGGEASSYTTALQNSANEMGSAFETLRASHPTTVEYTAANTQIQSGITGMQTGAASMNPAMFLAGAYNFQQGTATKAALDARAVQTQQTYTARLQTATNVETPLPSVSSNSGLVSGSGTALNDGVGGGQAGSGGSGNGLGSTSYSGGGSGAGSSGYSSGYGSGSNASGQAGQAGQMGQSAGQAGSGFSPQSAGNGLTGGSDYLNGGGMSGLDDGSGLAGSGGGGFAPYAPGGIAGLAGGGGSGSSGLSPSMSNAGRLIGQSAMAAPETTASSGLNSQSSKIGAVPGAAATGRGGMGPMMPPMGRGVGGDGDKDKERDKGLSPDIKVEDDTEYGPAVLGVRPRIASTRLPKAEA